ncbi:hypothetical protein [Deinococcus piscis]|nr:hypothetical protein [Deinococcus piscis]
MKKQNFSQLRLFDYSYVMPQLPAVLAHSTVTPALQQIARTVKTSPLAATIVLPRETAEKRIQILRERYPSVVADHLTRSALRKVGLPAVTMVIMPPDKDRVTVFLLSNIAPDDRENWQQVLDEYEPLTWRNYSLTTQAVMLAESHKYKKPKTIPVKARERITWRLSRNARMTYEKNVKRLIHGRYPRQKTPQNEAKLPAPGTTRSPTGVRKQLEGLGQHLTHYPGLSGIRTDIWLLYMYAARMWEKQYPKEAALVWPKPPYSRLLPVKMAPLETLWIDRSTPEEE